MSCGTDNIPQNIPYIQTECGKSLCEILLVPHNIVMHMNNVMSMYCSHLNNVMDEWVSFGWGHF